MKQSVDQFAFFGGEAAFVQPLHVGRPNIGSREQLFQRLSDALDRGWLTNDGPLVREFESRIAALAGVDHCVCTCNATVALEMAARVLGLTGEVIMPAFTFVASAHAFRWLGLQPVFCDIDPDSLTIDPVRVPELITSRTSAVMGVHVFGRPCAIPELEDLSRRAGLRLFFDAAHALACSVGGRMIGGFGELEVFSFHATKFINAFEGGAIVTDDGGLAAELRKARNFGFEDYDKVTSLGINGKMSEASAAMGLTSLDDLDDIVACNRRNHAAYRAHLADVPGIRVLDYPSVGSNYQYVVALVDGARTGLSRNDIVELLHAENVLARKYFHPGCHHMEPYASESGAGRALAVTDLVSSQVMSLPTGTAVTIDDIAVVAHLIRSMIALAPEISARLSPSSAPVVA